MEPQVSQSKIVTSPTQMIEAQVLHSLLSGITGFPLPLCYHYGSGTQLLFQEY